MPPTAPGPSQRPANSGPGKTPSVTGCAPKPLSECSKISRTTEHLRPQSSRIFDAETAIERELTLRLASLLWRIRRATAIETELFQMQAEILQERRLDHSRIYLTFGAKSPEWIAIEDADEERERFRRPPTDASDLSRDLALCFQRIIKFSGASFELLARHERALSRQIQQTLFLLRQETRRRRANHWQRHHSRRRGLSSPDQS
jgi:hypothetical protein